MNITQVTEGPVTCVEKETVLNLKFLCSGGENVLYSSVT